MELVGQSRKFGSLMFRESGNLNEVGYGKSVVIMPWSSLLQRRV